MRDLDLDIGRDACYLRDQQSCETNKTKIRVIREIRAKKRKPTKSTTFPRSPSYYNTGSCVHPRCITGIEITLGQQDHSPEYTLIKWAQSAQPAATRNPALSSGEYNLSIRRTVLEY